MLRRPKDAAAVFLRQTHFSVISRKRGDPFRRSSDSWVSMLGTSAAFLCLPGKSSDWLSPKEGAYHIQRRYRSGFAPDYLVQQVWFVATAATELLSNCLRYYTTKDSLCQQQSPPLQQNRFTNQHSSRLVQGLPRMVNPRKFPACRR